MHRKYDVELLGHAARDDQARRRPRAIQGQDDRDRRARAGAARSSRTSKAASCLPTTSGYPLVVRPAYTLGGTGGGFVYDEAELRATLEHGPGRRAHPSGARRDVAARAGKRSSTKSCATRRQLHRRLQHGEHRPGRRAHGRLDRRRAVADALRSRVPDAAQRQHQRDPRAQSSGRLQHSVRAASRSQRIPDHRGQSARLAQLGAGLESDRLSDRQDLDEDRARATRSTKSPIRLPASTKAAYEPTLDYCVVKIPALAVRQVSARRHARSARR